MLSINPVKSATHAKQYFMGKGNYYIGEGDGKSIWWGKGAELLGLSGYVKKEAFESLLKGHLPTGEMLGRKVDGKLEHRPGFDLTFSVPKSVSIVALRTEDKAIYYSILESTIQAVTKTLGMVEQSYAGARVTEKGNTTFVKTGNLIVALHLHELTRENEAGIHVHAVVMNMTKRSDGQWRSLASQLGYYGKNASTEINGFFEQVGHDKKQLGGIFRAELAYELKQKNFPIVITDQKQGFFEIDGVSNSLKKVHSTRSEQKEEYMAERGLSGGDAAARATQITRGAKRKTSQSQLLDEWKEKENAKGVDGIQEVNDVVSRITRGEQGEAALLPKTPEFNKAMMQSRAAVGYAIDTLTETDALIKPVQLINFSLKHALGQDVNVESIVKVITEMRESGDLVVDKNNSDIIYTTKELLTFEKEVIRAASETVPINRSIDQNKTERFLEKQGTLTNEQKEVVRGIFSSGHRITALEGKSSTGKTTLIKPMGQLAKEHGFEAVVLTPSKAGSEVLKEDIRHSPNVIKKFINSVWDSNQYSSVAGFIHQQTQHIKAGVEQTHPKMIFIDHAQMLSLKQIKNLSDIAEKTNARLVPIFDKKAILSWQSGNPLLQMLDHGMKTMVLEKTWKRENQRLQGAVKDTLEGNIKMVFETIEDRIYSIKNKEHLMNAMASMYARMTLDERNQTQVIMLSRAQCDEMNALIHHELKREQQIGVEGNKSSDFSVLVPKSMKAAEYQLANNYQPGQWVRFNESYPSLNVGRGEYLKISRIHKQSNRVFLEDDKGHTIQWNPLKIAGSSTKVEVFDEKKREISIGETLTWRRNNRAHNLFSGESLTVLAIKANKLVLERANHKKVSIDVRENQNRHFDYGYAQTPTSAVNQKVDTVIAYQNAYSRQSHQRVFYKVLSQAQQAAYIFTEDKQALQRSIQQHTGDKTTVLDTLLKDEKHPLNLGVPSKDYVQHLETIVAQTIANTQRSVAPLTKTAERMSSEAVNYALAHLAEREAAFHHKDVLDVALKYALGDVSTSQVQSAVIASEKSGELVRGAYSQRGTYWTTRDAIQMEREIIALAKADIGKMPPLVQGSKVEEYLSVTPMKKDHENAIREWMKAEDRVVIVQGNAGTGKTTMLQRVEPLLQAQTFLNNEGYQLLCLAPTHVPVKELRSRGLNAQTLDSFLGQQRYLALQGQENVKKYNDKLIIALDENSMTSNRKERDFLAVMREIQARALIIGDGRQYESIEAGKPHVLLQEVGVKTVYLTDIVRQKNQTILKSVGEVYRQDFAKALKTIKHHIVEVGRESPNERDVKDVRLQKIADDYLSLSSLARAKTVILTLGNKERTQLNDFVRGGLIEKGEISGNAVPTTVLVPVDMTGIEATRTVNYQEGHRLRFAYHDQQGDIRQGDYLTVHKIHEKENLITLIRENGEQVIWQPKMEDNTIQRNVEVYQVEKRELMAGDLIRWTRTDKERGLLNPELAKVQRVDKNSVTLDHVKITDNGIALEGKPFSVDLNESKYKHWDYAHVMTSFGVQSKSISNVLSNMESYSRHLTNQRALLIIVTRAIDSLTIYTDNAKALQTKIIRSPANKTSALETIGEVKIGERAMLKKAGAIQNNIAKTTVEKKRSIERAPHEKTKYFDIERIKSDLASHAEYVVSQVLGEPKSRTGTHYIYSYSEQFGGEDGKRKGGSVSVAIRGDKQGLWNCFKTGEGGDLLSLIQKKFRMDFKQSLDYATRMFGLNKEQMIGQHQSKAIYKIKEQIDKSDPRNWSLDEKKRVRFAQKLAKESQPISGTLAEKYLREHRGIGLNKLPNGVRFHPGIPSGKGQSLYPALLAIARNEAGQVQRVQAIFLDEKTANKADVEVVKRSYAMAAGSSVNLSRNIKNKQVSYLAEGVETGLSVLQSVDNGNVEVVLGISNFKHSNMKNLAKNVVLCLDNDGGGSTQDKGKEKQIHDAAIALISNGKTVWIAKPDEAGKDYNDVLKEQGVSGVKSSIGRAIPYKDYAEKQAVPTVRLKDELSQIRSEQLLFVTPKIMNETMKIQPDIHSLMADYFIKNNRESFIQLEKSEKKLGDIKSHFIDKSTREHARFHSVYREPNQIINDLSINNKEAINISNDINTKTINKKEIEFEL